MSSFQRRIEFFYPNYTINCRNTNCHLNNVTLFNREFTILGRERQPRLHKTKTAITEFKAVKLCINHNLKDLLSA